MSFQNFLRDEPDSYGIVFNWPIMVEGNSAILEIPPTLQPSDAFEKGYNYGFDAGLEARHDFPMPINVIFHAPATIVYWDDGDKTVVKCQSGDTYSAEAGLTAAMLKKYMGNDNTFNKIINEWIKRAYRKPDTLPSVEE